MLNFNIIDYIIIIILFLMNKQMFLILFIYGNINVNSSITLSFNIVNL